MSLARLRKAKVQQGFTLVELVMVVVLLGVISLGIIRYLTVSVQSYMDVSERTQMAQTGRFVIERLNREIRTALPGSIRVWTAGVPAYHCLEFIPVDVVTSYHALPVASAALSFNVSAFELPPGNASNYKAAVYNLDSCDVYGVDDVGANCGTARWFNLSGFSGFNDSENNATGAAGADGLDDDGMLSLQFNPAIQYPSESQARRVYLFQTPVAFCLQQGTDRLTRHQDYAFAYRHAMATPPANGVLLADGVTYDVNTFVYNLANHIRSASVELSLTLASDDESVNYNHEVTLLHAP